MKKIMKLFIVKLMVITGLMIPAVTLMAVPEDEVRVALMYEPSTVNMLEVKARGDLPPILIMHESLIATDPVTGVMGVKNSLSESITVMPDNKSIKFKIRKNSVFHTGDPVTAHDVKFTYNQVANPKNANLLGGTLVEIEEIEIIDDHTFIIHLFEPYAAWKELLWIGICSKKYYEKVGRKKFRKNPVGSGVYKFKEYIPGEYIVLEAFEKHPIFKMDFKIMKFMIVSDEVTRLAMLETGELDLVSNVLPHYLKRLKRNKHVVIKRESRVPSLYALAFKADNFPIFKDRNVGRAINFAINRQEIVDRVYLGEGYPLYLYASRSELGYDPKVILEYDPEKAKQHLKQSTYKPGDTLTLSYTSATPNSVMVAAMIKRYLKKIGITTKLQLLDAGVAATYSRNRDPREGHMSLYEWNGSRDPSMRLLLSISSDSIYASYTNRPKQKEIDALVKAQSWEMDEGKRLKILKELYTLLGEDADGPVLFGTNMIYAHSKRIDYHWLPYTSQLYNLHRIVKIK